MVTEDIMTTMELIFNKVDVSLMFTKRLSRAYTFVFLEGCFKNISYPSPNRIKIREIIIKFCFFECHKQNCFENRNRFSQTRPE